MQSDRKKEKIATEETFINILQDRLNALIATIKVDIRNNASNESLLDSLWNIYSHATFTASPKNKANFDDICRTIKPQSLNTPAA